MNKNNDLARGAPSARADTTRYTAVAKGLTFRPLAVTAKDTLDWHAARPAAEQQALADGKIAGMAAEREAAVLAAWKAKQGKSE